MGSIQLQTGKGKLLGLSSAVVDTVEIDATLTISGAAADAKATGDALAEKADKTELIGKAGTGEGAEVFNNYAMNRAEGDYAHAEGHMTIGSGLVAHAEGQESVASGDHTHVEGYGTNAEGDYQHVQGKYNVKDPDGVYAHIVGNGTSSTNRSNAHTLDWDGNAWFAGKVTVGADAEELATKSDLDAKADKQNEHGGFAAGDRSESTEGGGAIGYDTYAFAGGAVGNHAKVTNAGGAVGADSEAGNGGAVGEGAKTSSGFAGGAGAQAVNADGAGIDAIQLGTGTNTTPKTLQVYSHTVMNADGSLPYVHTARPYVEETLSEVLALNTIYDLGTQTSVTLKLPSANVGNFIQVDFLCGDTPATFTIDAASTAIVSDYDFTPEPDKAYSLFFDYGRLAGSLYGWRFSYAEYTYTEV